MQPGQHLPFVLNSVIMKPHLKDCILLHTPSLLDLLQFAFHPSRTMDNGITPILHPTLSHLNRMKG